MPKPGKRGSLGRDAGIKETTRPVLDRTTSMPNIGAAASGAPLAGPATAQVSEPKILKSGTSAAIATDTPTSLAPARVAPAPSSSRQHAVPVRPTAFRPVPIQALGPAPKTGRELHVRATAPITRVPAPVRAVALAAHAAAPAGSFGHDAGSQENHPVLDRATSLPNIGNVSCGAPPAGPTKAKKPPSTTKKKKKEEPKEGGGTSAALATGPTTTSAHARVALTPSSSRQPAVVVRPVVFRPVPIQAPGPAANSGRAPHARSSVPAARTPAPGHPTAPVARSAAAHAAYPRATRAA